MSNPLIDISQAPDSISREFRELHEDLGYFCVHRHDKLAVSTLVIIKYIVSCYDKESEVSYQFRSRWPERKREAAKVSGLTECGEEIDARKILFGKNDVINRIIARYISLQFDKDFMEYVVLQEMLMNATSQALGYNFDNPSQASKARQNISDLKKDLELLDEKMLLGGDVKELERSLAKNITKMTVSDLRPEKIVTRIENGEPVVDEAPYGDYVPDVKEFLGDE